MEIIQVISSCVVKMASNASPMSRLELTPWDLQLLKVDPMQKGLLFHKPQSLQIDQTFIDQLKDSFSRTLDFFPPLAGRLDTTGDVNGNTTTSFFVDCNNTGAEFTHAVAAAVSVSDVLDPIYVPEIVSFFFRLNGVHNYQGISKPLLAVQVTELVDGLFIGVTANHAVIDGTSLWHFFSSWSEISRGLVKISKAPVFKRWFPDNVDSIRLPPLTENNLCEDFVQPPLLERVFYFSKENLAELKAKANAEASTDRISSVQALSAHLWRANTRCRRRCCRTSPDLTRLHVVIGARERIPLTEGYFVNASYGVSTAVTEEELLEKGLGYIAAKINELVGKQTSEVAKRLVDDWIKNPLLYGKGSYCFIITGSPRFNVYGVDFGWGKPVAARTGKMAKYDGRITLCQAAVDGGIDVEVCMTPEILQAIGDDAEFMEAVSSSCF